MNNSMIFRVNRGFGRMLLEEYNKSSKTLSFVAFTKLLLDEGRIIIRPKRRPMDFI